MSFQKIDSGEIRHVNFYFLVIKYINQNFYQFFSNYFIFFGPKFVKNLKGRKKESYTLIHPRPEPCLLFLLLLLKFSIIQRNNQVVKIITPSLTLRAFKETLKVKYIIIKQKEFSLLSFYNDNNFVYQNKVDTYNSLFIEGKL